MAETIYALDGGDNIVWDMIDVIGSRLDGLKYDGEWEDLKIYNYAFTQQQAEDYHSQYAKRISLIETFEDYPVGATL
ncbi:MAG: hypothetical protein ACW98X_27515 [Promethearchaeota archaeon]|jgi:hypothetical protein